MSFPELLETISNLIAGLWALPTVKFLVYHVLLNVVVAVAAAIRTGNFEVSRIGEFLWRKLVPYLLVYFGGLAFEESTGFAGLSTVVFGLLEVTLLGDLTDNLDKLGIPMPAFLLKAEN